jgi:hypothetical protein
MNRFNSIHALAIAAALALSSLAGCAAPTGQDDVGQSDQAIENARVISVDNGEDQAASGDSKETLQNLWSHPGEKNTGPQPDPWVGTSPNDGPQPDPWHPPHPNARLVPGSASTDGTNTK